MGNKKTRKPPVNKRRRKLMGNHIWKVEVLEEEDVAPAAADVPPPSPAAFEEVEDDTPARLVHIPSEDLHGEAGDDGPLHASTPMNTKIPGLICGRCGHIANCKRSLSNHLDACTSQMVWTPGKEAEQASKPRPALQKASPIDLPRGLKIVKVKVAPEPLPYDSQPGTRVINFRNFWQCLTSSQNCHVAGLGCGTNDLEILKEKRVSLESSLVMRCKVCNVAIEIDLATPTKEFGEFGVNAGAVTGSIASDAEPVEEGERPSQNKLIILGICLCQFAMVLSIVSFIYLSVAIYMPSHRAFNSGFESNPVTCQTLELRMAQNCSWASCGEWCLTKTSGFCPQIHVAVRQNSTDIVLENCSRLSTNSCPQVSPESFKKFNCNNGTTCSTLTGLFNCTLGHCANMSDLMLCTYKADGPTIDSEKDNNKLSGFFECYKSRCTKIKKQPKCERLNCPKITTLGVNTFLMYEDAVYSGDCARAVATTAANGSSPGYPIPPTEIWTESRMGGYLLASCRKVERSGANNLIGYDCLNGTVLPELDMPVPFVNFTIFWTVFDKSLRPLDPTDKFLPNQKSLTIIESTKLFINLDGCVNTLRGECKEFTDAFGKDGRNRTAVSRFPCYYHKNDPSMAIARFDLNKARQELLIALILPSVLFAVSLTTLIVVTRSVKVDENSSILICSFRLCRGKTAPEQQVLEEQEALKLEKTQTVGDVD